MSNQQKLAVLPMWVIDRIKEQMSLGPAAWQAITDAVDQAEVPQVLPCEVKLPPSTVIAKEVPLSTLMLAIAQRKGYPVHARVFSEQHQGEPSARELQALRDEKLLGIERLPAEPSAPKCATCRGESMFGCTQCQPDELCDDATWKRRAIEAESKLRTYDPQVVELGERAMQALLAEPKPKELVLTKCALCDQLQADLTARDQQIDALRQGMKGDYDLDAWLAFVEEAPQLRLDAGRYRWLRSRDLEAISQGGVFAGLTPDNLVLNEETLDQAIDAAMAKTKCRHCGDTGQIIVGRSGQAEDGNAPIMEPCEDCDRGMPDLASRPEERGTPEAEPCSGCGTPGWTGACNKCVPY